MLAEVLIQVSAYVLQAFTNPVVHIITRYLYLCSREEWQLIPLIPRGT